MNLLIADDHKQITSILSDYAKKEGYTVSIANDGKEALSMFSKNTFDLVLLDVMMPEMDGFQVCREIRKTSTVPIIMVTARGEDFERIMGLDMGADDYIVKPFSPGEVMARIRAILRRISPDLKESQDKNILHYDNLTINIEEFTVLVENEPVSLTKKEIEILYTMAKNPNKLFTRDNLLNSLWGYDYFGDARTVDSHIKRLRAKLDSCHHPNWEIKTVWGMGYKFEVEHEL
ncbi:DNA-binding response regulator, OmpR family, contains REC and winged-helix (wHTH) domain [Proteiniclasticum ruminis]|uniref:Stage 0 sporulation protein A homolog n=2 Tax=Proteiniclasticum ruminis TaxID=398199 RepID=A0A1G8N720_9CLOT|nr:response regulator transcription factor [Proteiniclasticum ruminis]SDI76089.1 DNA-binding response regulator, OmpR family, contains REC and winged-helix (wHTH) domain [Proteiniclasticum ruminis]